MEFVGQVLLEGLDADVGLGVPLSVSPPFTTTQLPMDGYEEGKFCNA